MAFDINQPFEEVVEPPVQGFDRSKPFEDAGANFDPAAVLIDPRRAHQHATEEGKAAISTLMDSQPDEESKARSVNQVYLKPRVSYLPNRVMMQNWPAVRDGYAKSLGYTGGTVSEQQFTALLRKEAETDKKALWSNTTSPIDRIKLMFGDHGTADPDLNVDHSPSIGSEAAGTKGLAFTIPKMQGTGTLVGLINSANKFTSTMSAPENLGYASVLGGAGAVAEMFPLTRAAVISRATQAATLGTFTAVGAKDTANAIAEAKMKINDPKATNAERAEAIATVVFSAAMTAAAAKGTYDFAGEPKPAGSTEAEPVNPAAQRADSINLLRSEAEKSDAATAKTLNHVADEIHALPSVVEKAEPTKPNEAKVEDLDGGGFSVTDKDGNKIYVQDRADADALAKDLGAKAETRGNDRAEYDQLQKEMADMGYDKAGTPAFNELWQKSEDIKNRNEGMPPETKAAETPVKEPDILEQAKTPEAVQDSVQTAKQAVVGIKNASVDEALAKMGMEPATHGEKLSFEEARQDAAKKMEKDPFAGQKLIAQLEAEPRPVTGKENALLLHELTRLTNERAAAERDFIEATNMGDPQAIAEAKTRVQQATTDYAKAADIDTKVGTANAIGLSLRRMMMKEDYSLAALERRRMVANEGKPLTPEQRAEVLDLHKDIAAKEQAMKDAAEKRSNNPKKQKGKVLRFISEQADAARERIKSRLEKAGTSQFVEGENNGGLLSKENLVDLATVGAEHIAKGAVKLAEWSEQMVKDFGEAIKPHLKSIYDSALAKVEDSKTELLYAAKKARLKATIEDLQKKVDEGDTSRKASEANRPAVKEIEQLSQKRDELQSELADMRAKEDKVAELKAAIDEKTAKIEGNDLSTKGQPVNRPSEGEFETLKQQRDELNRKLAEARKEAAKPTDAERVQKEVDSIKKHIEEKRAKIEAGDTSTSGKKVNRPAIQAVEEARQELDELNRRMAELRNPEKTPEQTRLAKVESDIAGLEDQIASGEIFPKGKKPSVSSPEIKAAEERLAKLVEQRDNMRETIQPSEEPKTAQEKRLEAFKKRRADAIEELNRRIQEGDFESKPKPEELHLDEEANRLQAEHDLAKLEYDRLLERDRYEKSSTASKVAQQTLSLYDAARMLMTTGEFSFILRQGKVGALSHPILTAKAIPDTIRAFMEDPTGAHALNLKTLNHPDMPAAKAAKLHIIDEGAKLSRQEEILVGSKIAEKLPVVGKLVGRFEQAATVFLNKLRFDMWNDMRKVGLNPAEEKQLAMFVNEATGRGGLGPLEQAAVPLARLMFSPRFLASRIQLATGHSLWGGTWATRRIIAAEYAKTLVGLGLYYGALKLAFSMGDKEAEIGTDPRSSDFGKVKIGNTRIDPLAGISQVVVFAARTATGEKTGSTGKVTDIRGPKVPFGGDRWSDVAARFARSKLHPVPGAIINLFDGTDLGGNEATLFNQGVNLSGPVTYVDIYQALEEQDLPEGVSVSLLAMLGEGLQTYSAKQNHSVPPSRK